MTVTPLKDYITCQRIEPEEQASGGIYLPKNTQPRTQTLKVIAVGPDVTSVKVGDTIIYRSYTDTDVKIEGVEYLLVQEEDVVGVVKQ